MADFPVLSMSDWELLPQVNCLKNDPFLDRGAEGIAQFTASGVQETHESPGCR
jgi:hypothetical protein